MNKSTRNIVFVLVGLISLLALLWFYAKNGSKKYDWDASLGPQDKNPYGLSVFAKTLQKKYPSFIQFTEHTIRNLAEEDSKVDYFAVGHSLNYTRKELDTLYRFVRKGNSVFFSYKYVSDTTLMKFGIPKYELDIHRHTAANVGVNFTHPKLKKDSLIQLNHHESFKDKSPFIWTYLSPVSEFGGKGLRQISSDDFFEDEFDYEEAYDDGYYDEEDYEDGYYEDEENDDVALEEDQVFGREDTLSINDSLYVEPGARDQDIEYYIDASDFYGADILDEVEPIEAVADIAYINEKDKVICKRYKVGNGYVFLLSEPLVLTNFYYSNDTTAQVAEGILSHFNADKCILDIEATQYKYGGISIDASNTPLQYMLSKKWFKIGIYALLFCAFLFIVLSSFRKQRPVPVFNLPENKSIEQIKNIAAVLYHDKDIKRLKKYLKTSYNYWLNEHQHRLDKAIEEQTDLERLAFLERKDIWDASQIKEFQTLFNKLKSIYGN